MALSLNFNSMLMLIGFLALASASDLKTRKIPNKVTGSGILAALICQAGMYGWQGLQFGVLGLLTGVALLIIPYLMGAMGAGDAKMLGMVGAFIGSKPVAIAFLYIAVMGGAHAILLMVLHRDNYRGILSKSYNKMVEMILTRRISGVLSHAAEAPKTLCYGAAIAAGTMIYVILEQTGLQPILL